MGKFDKIEQTKTYAQIIGASVHGHYTLFPMGDYLWHDPATVEGIRRLSRVALCMQVLETVGSSSKWTVEADDDVPMEAVQLIEEFVKRNHRDIWFSAIDGMVCYGWAPYEKVFDVFTGDDGIEKITVRKLKPLLQECTTVEMEGANYAGLRNWCGSETRLDAFKTLVMTYGRRGDDLYGRAVFRAVQEQYENIRIALNNLRRIDAKKALAGLFVRYKQGETIIDGEPVQSEVLVQKLVRMLDEYNLLAIPADVEVPGGGVLGGRWDISGLPGDTTDTGGILAELEKYEKSVVECFGFAPRAIIESEFGCRADSDTGSDYCVMRVQGFNDLMTDQLNRYVVDHLMRWNYNIAPGAVRINAGPISQKAIKDAMAFFQTGLASTYGQAELVESVDWKQIANNAGVPLLPLDESGKPVQPAERPETLEDADRIEATDPPPKQPTNEILPQLLTASEAGELLGVSSGQVSRWRKHGLPYYEFGGRVKYALEEVAQWVKSRSSHDILEPSKQFERNKP